MTTFKTITFNQRVVAPTEGTMNPETETRIADHQPGWFGTKKRI